MPLATLSQMKEYLDITQTAHDARLSSLLERATDVIERFAARKFAAADYVEFHDGDGSPLLALVHYPVISAESLHDDLSREFFPETLLPSSAYVIEGDSGVVTLSSGRAFTKGVGNIRAAYRAGYETIPTGLEIACILLAAALFEERKNVGVASRSFKDGATSYRHGIPDEVAAMVEPYRRRLAA